MSAAGGRTGPRFGPRFGLRFGLRFGPLLGLLLGFAVVPTAALAADPAPTTGPGCAPDIASPAEPAARRIVQPGLEIAWRPVGGPIEVGRPFSIEFVLCPRTAPGTPIERLSVDAWMPAHRHGMNYRPTLVGAPPGPLRADGLLFHMPGRWQVVFELKMGERSLRLTDELTLR